MMSLKPQDTLLALKYWSLKQGGQEISMRGISSSIGISASEVSKATKRLVASRLAVERAGGVFAESGALLEWLCYGVRYAYPQESIGYGRGMATSWNCPMLVSEVVPPSPAFVWPIPGGMLTVLWYGLYMFPFLWRRAETNASIGFCHCWKRLGVGSQGSWLSREHF